MPNVVQLRPTRTTRPIIKNGKVTPPARIPNRDRRSREHLTPDRSTSSCPPPAGSAGTATGTPR